MTEAPSRRVVIVDGYSTGRELLHELLALNVECMHLRSQPTPSEQDYDASSYDADLGYVGGPAVSVEVLGPLDLMNVVPGSERGVELAARLSAILGLPINDPRLIPDRRLALGLLRSARQPLSVRAPPPRARQVIVNTVSLHERRYVTGAWRVLYLPKSLGGGVGALVLLDPSARRTRELIACALAELSRLGINNGAGHSLLEWTERGVLPLGSAACLMDVAMDRAPYSAAGMLTQAGVYAAALARSDDVKGNMFKAATYKPARWIAKVLFGFQQPGVVKSIVGLEKLRTLPSFFEHYRSLGIGDQIDRTSSWLPQGGVVYLVHDDLRQLLDDIVQFRRWDRRGTLYQLEAIPAWHVHCQRP
jgi:hypothetical protein